MLDLKKLDVLKEKMINAENFKEPWSYFFDHFAENSKFLDLGKKVKFPDLAFTLQQIAQQLILNPNVKITNLLVIGLIKQNFYHGAFFIENKLASFIFFKDISLGMVSVASSPRSPNAVFSRFSLTKLEQAKPNLSQTSLN
jgi:arginine exporter protein ArgO